MWSNGYLTEHQWPRVQIPVLKICPNILCENKHHQLFLNIILKIKNHRVNERFAGCGRMLESKGWEFLFTQVQVTTAQDLGYLPHPPERCASNSQREERTIS